jgi:subtilisin family serine protease
MKSAKWLLVLGMLAACGNKNPFQGRERVKAPAGRNDVGVLMEHASESEVEKILNDYPAAQVRVLSKEHGLYEIFGVETSAVAARTEGRVDKNQFFELIPPQTSGLASVPAPDGMEIRGLPPCKGDLPSPNAVLTVTEPALTLNGSTLELGAKVKLNTLASTANPASPSALKSAVILIAPDSSREGSRIVLQSELEFQPDALGVYQVIIAVQDAAGACALDGARFLVTANRPYAGPNAREINVNIAQMKHLAAVQAKDAWDVGQGEGVVIAVIDSGVNYNHPSLAPNMALNAREIPGNGIDDDHNGFKDDVLGYDFVNNDEFPYDDDGHGSHVAGLAAGKQFGLAKKARILAVKALTGIGGDVGTISAALRYAVDRGAKIVNMSLGAPAPLPHPAIVAAMAYAESKGVLVVTSAGNGDPQTGLGYSIDEIPFFPATLPNANVLTVAAFDAGNALSTYSNFGKQNVDVIGPGGDMPADPMFSCSHENPGNASFVGMSGTSMAAPVVSGIAAQVLGLQPQMSVAELKELLMKAGEPDAELAEAAGSGRHINAFRAVELAQERNVLF